MNTKTEATPTWREQNRDTLWANLRHCGYSPEFCSKVVRAVNAYDAHVAFINRVVEAHAIADDEKQFCALIDDIIHEGRTLVGNAKAEGK